MKKYNITIDILIANGEIIISTLDDDTYKERIGKKLKIAFWKLPKSSLKIM